MTRTSYPSDLTDGEWRVLEPLVPAAKPGGRPRSADMRKILNGVFYILRSGCAWRLMPHDLPKWKTVYDYFRAWRLDGVWEQLNQTLRERLRLKIGRNAQPSAGVLDRQSVKTTEVVGLRGYDGGKKVKGRRRHVLVDTQGLLLKVKVQAGNVSDREGGKLIGGVSQKMLTKILRLMEADGLVVRRVYPVVLPKVEYRLTDRGRSLGAAFCGVWVWAE